MQCTIKFFYNFLIAMYIAASLSYSRLIFRALPFLLYVVVPLGGKLSNQHQNHNSTHGSHKMPHSTHIKEQLACKIISQITTLHSLKVLLFNFLNALCMCFLIWKQGYEFPVSLNRGFFSLQEKKSGHHKCELKNRISPNYVIFNNTTSHAIAWQQQ